MPWSIVEVALNPSVRKLCGKPYPGHSHGCPNLGRKVGCPPRVSLLQEILDLNKPVWAVYNAFDMKGHMDRMRSIHPNWSDRQLRCCLYWQGGARKALRAEIRRFMDDIGKGMKVVGSPEACGVNVTETMASIGVVLEWPPVVTSYQIVLVGYGKSQ